MPPTSTLLARTQTLENSVNGYNDEEEVHHKGLIEKVADNATNIASLAEEIGSSSGGGGTLTSRIDALESVDTTQNTKISALETTVGNSTSGSESGLCLKVKNLETTVGDGSSDGLVKDVNTLKGTVGDTDGGLVKDVGDLQTDVNTLETTVGSGSSGLVGDVETLKNRVGTESSVNGLMPDVANLKLKTSNLENKWIVKDGRTSITPFNLSAGVYQAIFINATDDKMLSSIINVSSGGSYSFLTLKLSDGATEDDFYQTVSSQLTLISKLCAIKIG